MMKKELVSVVKVAVCMLFVLSLCLFASCKKSEEPEPTNADHPEHPVAATTPPAPPAPAETKAATAPAAAGLVPFEMELPKPMFVEN